MDTKLPFTLRNGDHCACGDIPVTDVREFREIVISSVRSGQRVVSFFGQPVGEHVRLYAVLADEASGLLAPVATEVGETYPALTPECTQVHWFEREIAETWAVKPQGHPWLKPIRFVPSRRQGRDVWERREILPAVADYYRMAGKEIHEVAVGPVHAGVIEPGHFRFQCHGEKVFHLEISLGYQHRGVERAILDGPDKKTIHYLETLAGDTSVGHTTAYCRIVESLAKISVPDRAQMMRGIALELERLANHTGDLGALANDVGFLPTASYCGRIRGDFLNMSALMCGSRFGRGLIRPGGVAFDADEDRLGQLSTKLKSAFQDVAVATHFLWNRPSILARFEETGSVSPQTAGELGMVGVAARASGLKRDVRQDFPVFFPPTPAVTWPKGDVYARAYVRWLEIQASVDFIERQLEKICAGDVRAEMRPLAPGRFAVSLVEGWRGEICHVAITGESGRFAAYKVVDPSFHNWMGLAMALRDQQISDFPLCNKSFNLSYCGHDL